MCNIVKFVAEHIRFSVDNEEIGQVKPDDGGFWRLGGFPDNFENPWTFAENNFMAPFDRRFYIILNVAVGGTGGYFPDTMSGSRKPWKNNSPQVEFQHQIYTLVANFRFHFHIFFFEI